MKQGIFLLDKDSMLIVLQREHLCILFDIVYKTIAFYS